MKHEGQNENLVGGVGGKSATGHDNVYVNRDSNVTAGLITCIETRLEENQREVRLRQQAGYDPLTRLPNRQLIYDLLERAIQRAERNRQLAAVLFLDVDGFAQINGTVGHYEGDLVLCHMVARLKSSLRKSDAVGRFGGDEFVVIVEALDTRGDVFPILRTLLTSFGQPVSTPRGDLKLECSIGISLCPTDGRDAGILLQKADIAMFQVKSNGRNGYRFNEALPT